MLRLSSEPVNNATRAWKHKQLGSTDAALGNRAKNKSASATGRNAGSDAWNNDTPACLDHRAHTHSLAWVHES